MNRRSLFTGLMGEGGQRYECRVQYGRKRIVHLPFEREIFDDPETGKPMIREFRRHKVITENWLDGTKTEETCGPYAALVYPA